MRIILLDARMNFRNDIRNRLLIDDDRNVELLTDLGSSSGLDTAISRYKPELIVVSDNVYPERSTWRECGVPVVGFLSKKTSTDIFRADGIPAYGVIEGATHLLNLLEGGVPAVAPVNPKPKQNVVAPKVGAEGADGPQNISFNHPADDMSALETPASPYAPTKAHQQMPRYVESEVPTRNQIPQEPNTGYSVPANGAVSSAQTAAPSHTISVKERMDEGRRQRQNAGANAALHFDTESRVQKTKTVAVYSAKGGVGKTTIATDLAVCLSLISEGRGHLRVCLVDYNIDFGDVLTTLNLDTNGPNLRHWAGEIRRRLNSGEAPESITYNAKQIEEHLQQFKNSSLYALVAPIAHEDSMEIESVELEIVLKNIIQNGQFDFVICDTGNNTRDSTVIALESADDVLLVATQDVSAVNCDQAFLNTMKKIGFDTSKIKLIINNIMPVKYTQVSVQEVENYFPYPCIARFRRDPEVTKANNCSEPIVYSPNHPFTQEMRKVCASLMGRELPTEKKKTGLFSRLKKKE